MEWIINLNTKVFWYFTEKYTTLQVETKWNGTGTAIPNYSFKGKFDPNTSRIKWNGIGTAIPSTFQSKIPPKHKKNLSEWI